MKTIHCPGCMFGFWHNWGVLAGFKQSYVYETISGSSLAATFHICGLNVDTELEFADKLRNKIFLLHSTLRYWLQERLPENCHKKCNGRLIILVRTFPQFKVIELKHWTSKEHLIESLIASASPFFPVRMNGQLYVDCMRIRSKYETINSKTRYYVISRSQAKKDYVRGLRGKGHSHS